MGNDDSDDPTNYGKPIAMHEICDMHCCDLLGPAFGRTDFFAIFLFAAGFFRGFCRRIFSSHFCGEKVPRKILQENPRQDPPNLIQQKSPTHFCRGAGATICGSNGVHQAE